MKMSHPAHIHTYSHTYTLFHYFTFYINKGRVRVRTHCGKLEKWEKHAFAEEHSDFVLNLCAFHVDTVDCILWETAVSVRAEDKGG